MAERCSRCGKPVAERGTREVPGLGYEWGGVARGESVPTCAPCFRAWGLRIARALLLEDRIRETKPKMLPKFHEARNRLVEDEAALSKVERVVAGAV